MVKLPPDLVVRPPHIDDAHTVFELITICDTAEYGEPDSTLGDLMDEWSGIHLGHDAWLVYEFVKAAFQRSGRTFPSFDRWKGYMMRADHFDRDLWFLLFNGNEMIGVALCYDYPEHGWVRQLGVAESWRRMGIGSALLRYVFSVFYKRGHRKVALGVDSERSNAYRLYEDVGMQRVRQYDEYEKVFEVRDNGED